jgi:CheY-like chemotaxis protein
LKVLVVDDEPAVRTALSEILTAEGHEVAACADGPAALERSREEAFDLVITDLSMPGMSGWEVAGCVKAERPETPVLLITGWGEQIDPAEARAKGVDAVLAKPFTRIDLAMLIVELIAPGMRRRRSSLRNRPDRAEDRGRSREQPGIA